MAQVIPRRWKESRYNKALLLLQEHGALSVPEIMKLTNWAKNSAYYAIHKLERRGWVHVVSKERASVPCITCGLTPANSYVWKFALTEAGEEAISLTFGEFMHMVDQKSHEENNQ